MALHKIINHKKEHGNDFPNFEHVKGADLKRLKQRIHDFFSDNYNLDLPQEMRKTQQIVASRLPTRASDEALSKGMT